MIAKGFQEEGGLNLYPTLPPPAHRVAALGKKSLLPKERQPSLVLFDKLSYGLSSKHGE